MRGLVLKNLYVSADEKPIVRGVDLAVLPGQVVALMGPNGSGKSTLANAIMGHPKYQITKGKILLEGDDITALPPHKRARAGLFLSLQHPPEIPGVNVANFLRLAKQALTGTTINPLEFHEGLNRQVAALKMDPEFIRRHVHAGFSGGEKKRLEILQLLVLNPKYAILDETDSGLDVDALKIVSAGINRFRSPEHGILLITHYNRMLEYVVPEAVQVMREGKIVVSGGKELAKHIETKGYAGMPQRTLVVKNPC